MELYYVTPSKNHPGKWEPLSYVKVRAEMNEKIARAAFLAQKLDVTDAEKFVAKQPANIQQLTHPLGFSCNVWPTMSWPTDTSKNQETLATIQCESVIQHASTSRSVRTNGTIGGDATTLMNRIGVSTTNNRRNLTTVSNRWNETDISIYKRTCQKCGAKRLQCSHLRVSHSSVHTTTSRLCSSLERHFEKYHPDEKFQFTFTLLTKSQKEILEQQLRECFPFDRTDLAADCHFCLNNIGSSLLIEQQLHALTHVDEKLKLSISKKVFDYDSLVREKRHSELPQLKLSEEEKIKFEEMCQKCFPYTA